MTGIRKTPHNPRDNQNPFKEQDKMKTFQIYLTNPFKVKPQTALKNPVYTA